MGDLSEGDKVLTAGSDINIETIVSDKQSEKLPNLVGLVEGTIETLTRLKKLIVRFNDLDYGCSLAQPIFIKNDDGSIRYVEAGGVKPGDRILQIDKDGNTSDLVVESVHISEEYEEVIDFKLEDEPWLITEHFLAIS